MISGYTKNFQHSYCYPEYPFGSSNYISTLVQREAFTLNFMKNDNQSTSTKG